MAQETYVQIEVARTGQKIRNLQLTAVQPDGTVATVLTQVVALADENGVLFNLDQLSQLADVRPVLLEIRGLLKLLVLGLTSGDPSDVDLSTL